MMPVLASVVAVRSGAVVASMMAVRPGAVVATMMAAVRVRAMVAVPVMVAAVMVALRILLVRGGRVDARVRDAASGEHECADRGEHEHQDGERPEPRAHRRSGNHCE